MELTGLYFTGIQELVTNDGKEVRQYVVYEDPDRLTDLSHAANTPGYIFIGYNGDITYYVSANYELATVLAKSPKATIVGFKSTSLPEGLKAEVNEKGIDRPQELEAKPFRYLLASSAEAR